ncbi:type II toxin-antitoxin system RelE/ParE family toxin [Viscerimonas tarda]
MIYKIQYSEESRIDIKELGYVIREKYNAPITAAKYIIGIIHEIKQLTTNPEIYAIQTRQSLKQYGHNVRRLNYKKMAIIYTVHGTTVYIHRIVPANTISGLSL